MQRHRALLSALATAALTVAAALPAIAWPTGAAAKDWDVKCAAGRCVVSTSVVEKTTGSRYASLSLLLPKDGTRTLVVTAPLGIAVEPGIRLSLSQGHWDVPVRVCFPDGCQATMDMTEDQFAALAAADKVDVLYFAFGKDKALAAELPLTGLSETLAGLPKQ